jgi:hypothetical protein
MSMLKRTHGDPKGKGRYRHWVWLPIAVGVVAVKFSPQLFDWLIKVEPPSPEVAQLALAATMTEEAQQLFYRQTPIIQPKQAFFQSCQEPGKSDESQIMLGCYRSIGSSGNIFIQAITDARFDGLMDVIAAHEMLHVAYHRRLSQSERDWLAPRLKQAAHRVQDRHLLAVLKQYETTDTERYINELHSHLGTELDDLGDVQLEEYYRRFFSDRHRVVAFSEQSQVALRKLDAQNDQLNGEILSLEANLKTGKEDLKTDELKLESGKQNLDTLRANLNDFRAQVEQSYRQGQGSATLDDQFEQRRLTFNQQVLDYQEQVNQYQGKVDRYNQQVDRYKQQVSAYNKIMGEKRLLLGELSPKPLAK